VGTVNLLFWNWGIAKHPSDK